MKSAHELTHNDMLQLHRSSIGGKITGLPREGFGISGLPSEGSGLGDDEQVKVKPEDSITKIMNKLRTQIIPL